MGHYRDWLMFDSREQLEKGLMGQDVKTLVSIILCQDDMINEYNVSSALSVKHRANQQGGLLRNIKTCGDFNFTNKAAMSILGDKHGS